MDIQHDEQKVFESVWQRVIACSAEPELVIETIPDDQATLSDLIYAEKCNHAFYHAALRGAGSSCSPLFNSLAQTSYKRLGHLQTFYFLISGNNCTTKSADIEAPSGVLSALKNAYWRESETASRLISAAASVANGKFSSYASEFARQSAENTEHIIRFICKIMN